METSLHYKNWDKSIIYKGVFWVIDGRVEIRKKRAVIFLNPCLSHYKCDYEEEADG